GKGIALSNQKKYSEAVAAFRQVTRLEPSYYPAWDWLGQSLWEFKKYPEALAAYDRAITIEPKDVKLHFHRGATLHLLQRYREAIVALDEAIKLSSLPQAYIMRGLAYSRLRNYQTLLPILRSLFLYSPIQVLLIIIEAGSIRNEKIIKRHLPITTKQLNSNPKIQIFTTTAVFLLSI
ncbi:MAG: tetratricopeptide repeat protein, partial [Hydrococcus sp. CSU_1_8]|nr:tetratricopeptide repeat protein [Hydrococcus sp. CSU_1_8]